MLKILTSILVLFPATLFASPTFLYCQTNSPDYIYLGDSMSKAIAACGNPMSKTEKTIYPTKDQAVTRWVYNYRPNSGFTQGQIIQKKNALIIDFVDKKVSSISVEGTGTQKTNYCNEKTSISIGDSMQKVDQVCFYPDDIKNIQKRTVLPSQQQFTLTVQPGPDLPGQKLYFVNDKLTKIGN